MMRNIVKNSVIILLICIQFVINSACSDNGKESNNADTNNTEALQLCVSTLYSNKEPLFSAINLYNSKNNIKIEKKVFTSNDVEESRNKFTLEIMSGQSSDIVIIEKGDIPSPNKAIQSGAFLDLNKLLAEDKSFDFKLYNNKVLESGVVNNKRYFIPLGYNVFSFLVQDSIFKDSEVRLGKEIMSWDQLGTIAKNFTKNNSQEYFFYSTPEYLFYTIMQSRKIPFVDYLNKKSRFNSDEFIETLELFKIKIYPTIVTDEVITKTNGTCLNKCAIWDNGLMCAGEWKNGIFNKQYKYYVMPTYSGEKTIFLEPSYLSAISSHSKNQKEAYNFIKFLLSKEGQVAIPYFPINKKSLLENTNIFFENIDSSKIEQNESNNEVIPKEKIEKQFNSIEEQGNCQLIDYSILDIIKSELYDYLNGKKTAEQVSNIIDQKVQLYLNE